MKKVLSPDMVAHTFAHQSQDEARNSNNSLFFHKDSIYSYGRHFCIAKFVSTGYFPATLLFTTRRYSNTTAKHISIVGNATSHIHKIYCPFPDRNHTENLTVFKSDIKGKLNGLAKAKKPEKYIQPAQRVYDNCVAYCKFFSIEVPEDITDLLDSAKTGEYADYLHRENDRIIKEREEAAKQAIETAKKSLVKWRTGKLDRAHGCINGETFLRLSKNGRIETSQNIEVPIELGKRLFKLLYAYQASPIDKKYSLAEKINSFKVLDFKINELTDKGIRAGCHYITFKEINKLAKKLNWI